MSVRLAVQLFSGSTASAMEFYSKQEGCQKLHNSAGTYDFRKQMNDLFDCLNSRRPQDVQYNEAEHIATLKANIKWLEDCCTYIESLPKQRQVCFLSKPTCGALRITLHSTVALIDRLLKSGFRYVLVGNLGQDPLERFFGIARHVAGDGGQPTVQQFLFIYRMLSVNNLVRPPKRASVDGSGPQLLLTLQGLFDKEKPSTTQVDTLAVLLDDVLLEPTTDCVDDIGPLSTKDSILDYLGGYVAKKFSTLDCLGCIETMLSTTRQPSALIQTKSRGYLKVPSSRLLALLKIVEEHVETCKRWRHASLQQDAEVAGALFARETQDLFSKHLGVNLASTNVDVAPEWVINRQTFVLSTLLIA
nr:uncharacterized protein LOC119184074 [Rhipicephalus microplus]